MSAKTVLSFAAVLFLSTLASAQQGKFTTYTTTWNGFQRLYSIYTPPVLQSNPALVMALHQTANGPQSNPPLTVCTKGEGWDKLADLYGFLVLCPVSTWKAFGSSGAFFWQAYSTDSFFPVDPDDSGFLRSLILSVSATYAVDPRRIFVTGMSSGAMMTHRVGIDSSDLVAAIAPVSGTVWIGSPGASLPSQPVSVLEFHGDADPVIRYCGGRFFGWGESAAAYPAVDADVNYWLAADGLAQNSTPLCTAGQPTANVFSVDMKSPDGKIEVEFRRRLGVGHTYGQDAAPEIQQFFATHGRN